jgi:hypothetical protein
MDKRKRVRFGCTLAADVMDILDSLSRSPWDANDKRPTRTQIIEDAVRAWWIGIDKAACDTQYMQPVTVGMVRPAEAWAAGEASKSFCPVCGSRNPSHVCQPSPAGETASSERPREINPAYARLNPSKCPVLEREAGRKVRICDRVLHEGSCVIHGTIEPAAETAGRDRIEALARMGQALEVDARAQRKMERKGCKPLPDLRGVTYGTTEQTGNLPKPPRGK